MLTLGGALIQRMRNDISYCTRPQCAQMCSIPSSPEANRRTGGGGDFWGRGVSAETGYQNTWNSIAAFTCAQFVLCIAVHSTTTSNDRPDVNIFEQAKWGAHYMSSCHIDA